MIAHVKQCMEKNKELINGVDYVVCQICNFHAQNLGIHLAHIHHIDSKTYAKQYSGLIVSDNSRQKYSKSSSENNWLSKAINEGQDLTEYWRKVGAGVKRAIAADSKQIEIRSQNMILLNQKQQSDPNFQKIVSETAQKTSARPDIQLARSVQLKNWRDNNPEEFYEKCVKKMITSFQSKPEKKLFEFVMGLDGFIFKRNQFAKSITFSSLSKKRQIDILDKEKRIYIEYDGIIHFNPIFGSDVLDKNKIRDLELEDWANENNYILIRISYDQFKYSTKMVDGVKQDNSSFKKECLDSLIEILKINQPGVYKIGEAYGQH